MSIDLLCGPMFSGKTSGMYSKVERHHIANRRCLIVKFLGDNRWDCEGLRTHRGDTRTDIDIVAAMMLSEVDVEKYDVVGIDEVQFFPDAVEVACEWADNGKIIICAGLDSDVKRRPFPITTHLVSKCDTVVKLLAVCNCSADALFTKLLEGEATDEINIGGKEKYTACCRRCYLI